MRGSVATGSYNDVSTVEVWEAVSRVPEDFECDSKDLSWCAAAKGWRGPQ